MSSKEFVVKNLGSWVLEDPEFSDGYEVVSCEANASDHTDGFMSTIYMCDVVMRKINNDE